MPPTNHRVLLKSRPEGRPTPDNFAFDEQPIPEPGDGELVVRNLYMSVDPYMRGRMNDVKSYISPFEVGEPLEAGVVGQVSASRDARFAEGDYVTGMLRWETHSLSDGSGLRKINPDLAPITYHLGILGMPGMTAWVGLKGIGEAREGERVFVTAASGAVGSVVGQIAKNLGCYVAGTAGSDAKVEFLTGELGFDAAFNYKTVDSVAGSLPDAMRAAVPEGIDVHFENVGGLLFEAAIFNMRNYGRIALCGMIADYNAAKDAIPPGPRGLFILIGRRVRMQGFIVSDHPDICREWVETGARWLAEGKLRYRESIAEGIENAPAAFLGLMRGENFGKQLVRLGDE